MWRNWYTRMSKEHVASALRVQVSPSALFNTDAHQKMSHNHLAIIFVSNGPGELATWVRPLAQELHKQIALRPKACL